VTNGVYYTAFLITELGKEIHRLFEVFHGQIDEDFLARNEQRRIFRRRALDTDLSADVDAEQTK